MSYRSRYFSFLSRLYPLWYSLMQCKAEKWIIAECKQLEPKSVLESGIGSGELFALLLMLFPEARFMGTDISTGMIRQTQRKIHTSTHSAFSLEKNNIVTARFDCPFDLIVTNFVIDTLSELDIKKALTNIHDHLTDEGTLLISTLHEGMHWYEKILPAIGETLPFLLGYARPIDIESYLEEANFKVVKKKITSQNGLSAIHLKVIKNNV